MFDKKLLIPIFLVFLFILALLILPALDPGEKPVAQQPEPQITATPAPLQEQAAASKSESADSQSFNELQKPPSGEAMSVPGGFADQLEALWPLGSVPLGTFGELSAEHVDVDRENGCTYLTFITLSDLYEEAAARQYGEALFGKTDGSPPFKGTVDADGTGAVKTSLDISKAQNGTLVTISFSLEEQLSLIPGLCSDNPELEGYIFNGLEEQALIIEGIIYTAPSEITLYKVYSPPPEIKTKALEWYSSSFSEFAGFSDTALDDVQSISFLTDSCKINVCEYLGSLIKITVTSSLD